MSKIAISQGAYGVSECNACDRAFEICSSWDHLVNAVALRIRQTLELSQILQTTVDEVDRLLGCDRVLIYRFEPDWSGRVISEAVSDPQWSVMDRVVHDSCFEASWIEPFQANRYFATEDIARANLTPCHAEFLASFQVKANLVIPVFEENTLWGLLIAHHCQAPRIWQPVEIEGLQLLAVQVGIAIHQAALIEQLQTAKSTLEAEVAARTQELVQVNQALQEANQQLVAKVRACNQVASEVIQRETFLQQVLNGFFAFVWVMTPDGILIEANQSPLELAGLTRDDVIGKPFANAYWWSYSPEAQAAIRSAIETANQGTIARFDIPVQMQGGRLITIDFALTPLFDPQTGRITHLIPSGVDISDRLQAESDRTRLLNVLEASLNEVYLFDAETLRFEYANQGALQNLGYSLEQLQQMTPVDIKPEISGSDFETLIAPLRRQDVAKINFETVHQRADGSPYPVDVHLQLTQQGNKSHFLAVILDITDRKLAETKRLQDQTRLQQLGTIVDSSNDAIISKTPDGIVTSWNNAAAAMFGYTAAEMLGQPITTIIPPDRQDESQRILEHIRQGHRVETYETQRLHKDGHRVDVSLTISPIYDANGQVIGASKIARDISAQKQAETMIRDQAETLRIFYETSPLMMGLVEISETDIFHLSANPATLSFFSLNGEALTNHWASEVGIPDAVIQLWLTHYRQSQQQQRPVQFDYTHITPAAQYNLLVTVSFIGEGEGEGDRFSYIVQDLTENKQLEQEKASAIAHLHDSEQRYASLVAAVPVGIFRTDAQGHCIYVNQQWTQLAGLTMQEALGEGWVQAIYPDDRAAVFTAWTEASQERRTFELEYRFQSTAGTVAWVYGQAVAEYSATGDLLGYVGTITDITDRKEIELERQRTEQMRLELGLLEQILEIVLAGYWDWHIADNEEYLSPGLKKMLGYADHELVNAPETWQALIFPEDLPGVFAQFNRHVQSHGTAPFYNEVRYRHKDGSTVWIICSGQVIEWDDAGNPLRMIGCHIDITERKQTKDQLELVLQASSEGFWDWDLISNDIYFSPHWKAMLGYADHELDNTFEMWESVIFEEDHIAALQLLEDYNSGKVDEFKTIQRFRHKDGSTVFVLSRAIHLKDANGQVIRMVGSHLDITANKQQELALQTSEARYRKIIETTLEGVWMLDSEGKTTFVNQRMAEMLGYDAAAMQHQSFLDFMTPAEQAKAKSYFSRRMEGIEEQHSFKFCRQDGADLWTLVSATPIFEPDGTYQGAIGLLTDITPLVNSQEALKESELRLSGILNSSLDGIMAFRSIRDDQGQIVDFEWLLSNPTSCQIVHKRLDELIGHRLLDVLPGNRTDGLFDLYVDVVETGNPTQQQFHYAHDGIDTWFENIAVKLGDGFVVTFRDISAVKQSEQALQQANSALELHLKDLRQRNDEMLMLSETSDFLQACRTLDEACSVIWTLVQPLFPECSGSFYITCASRNRVESVARWGDRLYSQEDFQPHDCWALRRGRWHSISPEKPGLRCNHTRTAPSNVSTLCIPMIAQGETLGMFYLSSEHPEALNQAKQQLARTVAEQVGLAIANLNLRETLQNQSIRDGLTGLYNRRYLEEALHTEIARAKRYDYSTAVVMVDVDHFKAFNDQYGHDAGDAILKAIAQVLKDGIRGSDIACRYGGEEMTLVFPETSLSDALAKAEALRIAIHQLSMTYGKQTLSHLTASFGVAIFPDHGTTGAAVIQSADAALYRAKTAGRNQVVAAASN